MGVSPFDNYVPQDYRYKTDEEFAKVAEAINRSWTPSVPIEHLGGRQFSRDDLHRIGFVDFGVLSDQSHAK